MATRTIEGRIALVTGANRGLGAAFVEVLLDRGAAKVICSARDPSSLTLSRFGPRAEAVKLDVTDTASIQSAAQGLAELDLLVSNAGITYMTPLMDTTLEHSRLVMETNFFGPLQLVYAFGRRLNDRGGGFISILSLAGLVPAGGAAIYSASKAASAMVGHAINAALPDVAVSLVYPGLMDTDMMKTAKAPKTPPAEVARRSIEGWLAGEHSVFPDLHAECARDAFLHNGQALLASPLSVMGEVSRQYIEKRATT
jgi:NAD(P)-dependent dehydrogenase (short-subunit alcohol dehydrogenase family)